MSVFASDSASAPAPTSAPTSAAGSASESASAGASIPQRGRTIRLVAPSGYPENAAHVARGIARLCEAGHVVENIAATSRRFERFAGTDAERLADLNGLAMHSNGRRISVADAAPGKQGDLTDPADPDIVMAVRGGYGAIRLLQAIDYDGIARRFHEKPPVMTGYSDFTAIQMALYAQAKLITFGGPMLSSNFGQETLSEFTMSNFWGLIQSPSYSVRGTQPGQPELNVGGTLWGGNLAMLASLVGTPYMPVIDGGILFIEDINEQPFRTERMLYQLYLGGILQRQQAIVMGIFSESSAVEYNNGFTLDTVADQIRQLSGVPVVRGLQFGHVADMVTLPVGAHANLRSHALGFELTMRDYPVLG